MKFNVALFRSEEFVAWIVINAIFPTFMIGLMTQIDIATTFNFPMLGKQILAISSIIIILFANIHFAKRWRNNPAFKYFVGIIILNIIAFFYTSSISFLNSLPHWPTFLKYM